MKTKFLFSIIFFFLIENAFGQDLRQKVKGNIVDHLSHSALVGATIKVSNTAFEQGATTNESGYFEITDVPTGRYRIQISFTGYASTDDELLVISGREALVNVSLIESATILDEVQVAVSRDLSDEVPGLRSFTIEKTMRTPANFFDPVRMATTYPGVVAASDQANSIIINGNSPNGLLWRLNGIDIVNPNHLSNAGTLSDKPMANGGGVNILSAQMLDRTDLYTNALPSNYGNALSGVVDMNLRTGNKNRMEYTAQASLIGLDMAAEGPLDKKQTTSFLANYRYSTVGLLSKMGIDFGGEVIDFQDFSFNLNKAYKKGSTLSFFGFGGLSKNTFKEKVQTEWKEDKDRNNINYKATTYALGFNYHVPFKKGSLSFALGYSSTDQNRNLDASLLISDPHLLMQRYDYSRSMLSNNAHYETKVGQRVRWEIGIITNYIGYNLNSFQEISTFGKTKVVDGSSKGILLQPYTTLDIALTTKLKLNAGLRYVRYTYAGSTAFEPRVLLNYNPASKTSFDLSYGLLSQMQLPVVYFTSSNKRLGLSRAHHVAGAFHQVITSSLKLNIEVYYQKLFDIPVESNSFSNFSAINLLEGEVPANLINGGSGENYGINASVEKSFYNANYFMVGGSYYESTYQGGDGKVRDSRFNGKYMVNATYGKEWPSQKKNRTFSINTRLLYLGGLRETPVDVTASQRAFETIYDESRPFNNKLKDYFRVDLRVSVRKNKPKYTRTLALDIQNVTGQQNEAYHYYDFTQGTVVTKFQLGLIPVLVYRVDF